MSDKSCREQGWAPLRWFRRSVKSAWQIKLNRAGHIRHWTESGMIKPLASVGCRYKDNQTWGDMALGKNKAPCQRAGCQSCMWRKMLRRSHTLKKTQEHSLHFRRVKFNLWKATLIRVSRVWRSIMIEGWKSETGRSNVWRVTNS